jgi:hypothetical protein
MHIAETIEATSTDAETLADQVLGEAAAAEGISPDQLLSKMALRASSNTRSHCLQPHDLERLNALPEELHDHIGNCSFCRVLMQSAFPNEAEAAAYGAQVCRPERARNSRWAAFRTLIRGFFSFLFFFKTRKWRNHPIAGAAEPEGQMAHQRH